MKTRDIARLLIPMVLLAWAGTAHSLPIVDQTGNLALNGNFEDGTTAWVGGSYVPSAFTNWMHYNHTGVDSMPISTRQVGDPLIDGNYAAHIVGGWHDLIYQYDDRSSGFYSAGRFR